MFETDLWVSFGGCSVASDRSDRTRVELILELLERLRWLLHLCFCDGSACRTKADRQIDPRPGPVCMQDALEKLADMAGT